MIATCERTADKMNTYLAQLNYKRVYIIAEKIAQGNILAKRLKGFDNVEIVTPYTHNRDSINLTDKGLFIPLGRWYMHGVLRDIVSDMVHAGLDSLANE